MPPHVPGSLQGTAASRRAVVLAPSVAAIATAALQMAAPSPAVRPSNPWQDADVHCIDATHANVRAVRSPPRWPRPSC